jgi:penicillin-binding protein 1C
MFLLSLPDPLFDVYYSPVLYDREGRLLGALVALDGQWRFPPGDSVDEKFAAALIEAEDRRFRYHPGVDIFAIYRAFIQNLRAGRAVSGGSTITMQTIRLMRCAPRRTLFEKGVEAVLALRLELGRSKDDIIALYAANAPFGANVVGLEAASWRWFGRSPEELSWAEAAVLAVLPNSPAAIHPGRNRAVLKTKRDVLLERLCKKGFFDEETLRLACSEPLPGEPLPLPQLAPHLLARLVKERGGVSSFSGKTGTAIHSSLDRAIQERSRLIMNRAAERFAGNGIMNGACLIINTRTGETVAYVGNVASPTAADVDVITARRSSGSLLKPFLYAVMLDSGDLLPTLLVSDIPTRVGSYSPENITRRYLGVIPADEALARSLNVPAVRSLRVFGVDRFARFLRSLGLTTLFRPGDEYGLPLILGGAEVTLWEMTGLYAGLARSASAGGEAFFFPVAFPRDDDGLPYHRSLNRPLISPGAAWLTLDALCFAVRPGEEAHWQEYAGKRRIAWKTGTSFGFRDAWAIGVTPEWTVGVWIGNAAGEGRAELRSAVTSAPVLFELFSALDSSGRGSGGVWFPQPAAELRTQEVCAFSGYPPGPDCHLFKSVSLPRSAPPHRSCPFCTTVTLNEAGNRRVALENTATPVIQQKRFVLPPAEEWYYRRWNLDYKPLPPPEVRDGTFGRAGTALSLALFNPEAGSRIFVPRELDDREGRIVFSAAHRDENGVIYWHLDESYLGFTKVFHEMEARPPPGLHILTLVDGMGNTLRRSFTVLDGVE